MHGVFDFNKKILASPGTRVVFYSKPTQRASWTFHDVEGWYVDPAPNHYHFLIVCVSKTRSQIVSDTVTFILRYITIPKASLDNHLKKIADYMINLLAINHLHYHYYSQS